MSLPESKITSECQECGVLFTHWRSVTRKYCSHACSYKHPHKTHGMTNTSEYKAWKAMKRRCYSEIGKEYYRYGGRGITVCDSWLNSFEKFFIDMGKKPSRKCTLERIDNDGDYEPANCKWATYKEQANNTKRTNYALLPDGRRITLMEIHQNTGIHQETLRKRIKKGWTYDQVIQSPRGSKSHVSV